MDCASSTTRSCADDPADTITSALVGAAPYPPRSLAMVLVNLNGLGVNTDAASVMGRLVGNADSIRNYYLYDSYGMQDINAQVFGPDQLHDDDLLEQRREQRCRAPCAR